jgi:hypothetical protein
MPCLVIARSEATQQSMCRLSFPNTTADCKASSGLPRALPGTRNDKGFCGRANKPTSPVALDGKEMRCVFCVGVPLSRRFAPPSAQEAGAMDMDASRGEIPLSP